MGTNAAVLLRLRDDDAESRRRLRSYLADAEDVLSVDEKPEGLVIFFADRLNEPVALLRAMQLVEAGSEVTGVDPRKLTAVAEGEWPDDWSR